MLTVLTVTALRWMEQQRLRAALRHLLAHDDATLNDIGLPRAEIERRLAQPLEVDVGHPALWPPGPHASAQR
mgnify:CR=1 FL=1